MTALSEVCSFLDTILETSQYSDSSQNGLQVESSELQVKKIAVSVDSGLSVIEKAIENKADLLIVHHGLFWGYSQTITGNFGKKINRLIRNNCSLYCSHLPLDGHISLGNAAVIAQKLGLSAVKSFYQHGEKFFGVKGKFSELILLEDLTRLIEGFTGTAVQLVLPFGKKAVRSVGIVTGSGSFAIDIAAKEGLDVLITGESKQEAFHTAKEFQINTIFAGHYATETFGVAAVGNLLKEKFGVSVVFIDEPTGI